MKKEESELSDEPIKFKVPLLCRMRGHVFKLTDLKVNFVVQGLMSMEIPIRQCTHCHVGVVLTPIGARFYSKGAIERHLEYLKTQTADRVIVGNFGK